MRQQNGDIKEQIDTYEKRLQTAEDKLTKMKLKNKSIDEIVQKADAGIITQTANVIDYNPMHLNVFIMIQQQ